MSSNRNYIDNLEMFSTWILENGKLLKNTLSLDYSNKSVELEDVVQVDSCVRLVQGDDVNNKGPCTVTITLPESSPCLISQLVIVSEARIIELYGNCEEYLSTCTAEYVDDFEDCAVYMADCVLKPVSQIQIKFQRTKHANSLWLYGIKVKLLSKDLKPQALSSINFQTVNDILKEAKFPISENAEKCKAFLQNYGAGTDQNQQLFRKKPSQLLMKMLESDYFNSCNEKWKNESNCMANVFPSLTNSSKMNMNVLGSGETASRGQASEFTELKNYIDNRLAELEKRVDSFEQKVMEIDKRQQAKLDCIIELLRK